MVGPADAYGGMPLLQADYDGRRFDREALSAANERRFLTSGLFRAYAGVDNMNTQQKAVHVSILYFSLYRSTRATLRAMSGYVSCAVTFSSVNYVQHEVW